MLISCDDEKDPNVNNDIIQLSSVRVGTYDLDLGNSEKNTDAPIDELVVITFTIPLELASVPESIELKKGAESVPITFSFLDGNKTVSILPADELENNQDYSVEISENLKGAEGETFDGYSIQFRTVQGTNTITFLKIGDNEVEGTERVTDISQILHIEIGFLKPLDPLTVNSSSITLIGANASVPLIYSLNNENKTVTITSGQNLKHLLRHTLTVNSSVKGSTGESFSTFSKQFYTTVPTAPQFPVISDDALLTLVQEQTFKYFYDFAHPVSGMARERNTSGDIVTSGGSGFGIMALIVGMERNFITRQEGLTRMDKILDYLETADRFHGAWSHWINGNTGDVVPFSANDNGGDLVETSFLVEGLITFRQYLNENDANELLLMDRINTLWQGVEWDWYRKSGENVLYWHWSPDKAWIMNHQIKGYNECLITYVLAASSPTHAIDNSVYTNGWASNGAITNGKNFYNITLPLGFDYGGPLFFTHYSFLGLDPRNLSDAYGNYWTQNVNHSLINHAHSVVNPKNFVGYSDEDWGLTASDNHLGYSAHSPTNDLGVISPTAALSSFPYTPEQSMKALEFFYYKLGDRLWGPYGFYDAFNLTEGWVANSYLAIDQGPIVVMIENHRTGLLWNLFMSAPEVQTGLDKLSFSY